MFDNCPKYKLNCWHFMNERMPEVWTSYYYPFTKSFSLAHVYDVSTYGHHANETILFKCIFVIVPWNFSFFGKFKDHSGANAMQTACIPILQLESQAQDNTTYTYIPKVNLFII